MPRASREQEELELAPADTQLLRAKAVHAEEQQQLQLQSLPDKMRGPPSEPESAIGEQELFRHRFLVSQDFCIRMPLDALSLLVTILELKRHRCVLELRFG